MPAPTPPFSAILFDLDGTIVDSAPGITATLAHTLEELGEPIPSPAELVSWVGPPILDSFRDKAGFDERRSAQALRIYRRRYLSTGVFDARLYPGVPEVLRTIHDAGIPLSLATSKPETPSRMILEHFELARYFTHLTGAKSDVVLEALRRLRAGGAGLHAPIMVGDRHHDIAGASERGVPTIFVSWGYGAPEEQAGAVAVAHSADDLVEHLGLG